MIFIARSTRMSGKIDGANMEIINSLYMYEEEKNHNT